MSKNITIQEGGIAKQITADKLKTNLVGGGTCLWVPEDGTQLTTKHISENGTYKASDDGYYGYSEVTVSGIGTATGTGPDGETHTYAEDGEGGITDTVLPDSISVVTPPTVTTYADGATIDFSGMVVKGYLKSGDLWTDSSHPDGIIQISELLFPVTVADSDEVHGATISSDLITTPFAYGPVGMLTALNMRVPEANLKQVQTFSGADAYTLYATATSSKVIAASATDIGNYTKHTSYPDGSSKDSYSSLNLSYTHNEEKVYYGVAREGWGYSAYKVQNVSPDGGEIAAGNNDAEIAWTMIYGSQVSAGGQTIPVQYTRSDAKTLESSFLITVTPAPPSYGMEGY